jgi:hypothetical protein
MTNLYDSIKSYANNDPIFAEEIDSGGYYWGNSAIAVPKPADWQKLCVEYLEISERDDPCAKMAALNAILDAAAAFDAYVLH